MNQSLLDVNTSMNQSRPFRPHSLIYTFKNKKSIKNNTGSDLRNRTALPLRWGRASITLVIIYHFAKIDRLQSLYCGPGETRTPASPVYETGALTNLATGPNIILSQLNSHNPLLLSLLRYD